MRNRVIKQETRETRDAGREWLDLVLRVLAELTSEDAGYPVEAALGIQAGAGWCAQQPGKQTIRLLFDAPRRIRSIQLVFEENDLAPAQEFAIRWTPGSGAPWQEIVRQQYSFSPPDSRREVKDYVVDIDRLAQLDLTIIPDISGEERRVPRLRICALPDPVPRCTGQHVSHSGLPG